MIITKTLRALFLISCFVLAGCGQDSSTSTTSTSTSTSTDATTQSTAPPAQTELGGEIGSKTEGEPQAQVMALIYSAASAQSVHDYVKTKYGSLSPQSFGQFFTSQQFRQLLSKKCANPQATSIPITWEAAVPDDNQTRAPHLIVLFPAGEERIDCTQFNETGQNVGGGGIELHVLYSADNPEG